MITILKQINIKNIIRWLPILLFIMNSSCLYGQDISSDEEAMQMLKKFYTAYNIAWSTTKDDHVLIKQLDSLKVKYCSASLLNKLRKEFKSDGLDHDLLINDEYTDAQHIKEMSVIKDAKANSYIVSYIDSTLSPSYKPINKKVTLHVTVTKENELYKIASVQ